MLLAASVLAIYIGCLLVGAVNEKILGKVIDSIADKITKDIQRGVTVINSQGYYSKKENDMICCAISKYEIQEVKELIEKIDSNAFVIITQAKEVLGYGFKQYTN